MDRGEKADCILTFLLVNGWFYGLSQKQPDGGRGAASPPEGSDMLLPLLFAFTHAAADRSNYGR